MHEHHPRTLEQRPRALGADAQVSPRDRSREVADRQRHREDRAREHLANEPVAVRAHRLDAVVVADVDFLVGGVDDVGARSQRPISDLGVVRPICGRCIARINRKQNALAAPRRVLSAVGHGRRIEPVRHEPVGAVCVALVFHALGGRHHCEQSRRR